MIHPTAIIHKSAKIAENAEIGPYAIIGENTVIAPGSKIGSHALLEFAEIGENCSIYSHATVGTAPQDLKYKGETTKLIMGPNCTVREFAALNRGTQASGKTVIGSGCFFMAYVHVAHDCRIGNNVILANLATLGGHVEIGERAFLGGACGVHQFNKIGRMAMIGGGSMVTLDVIPFSQVQGDRATLRGLNLVGLKRASMTKETIEEIKSAYRTLFLSGLLMEEALEQLEAAGPGPEVREMIQFIHDSKRGICRPLHKELNEEAI
ncbi:MAG: acyl-ACP--UDP-N-acetylglucosamine O-acyltransferase [Elusimicrobiota bacterium]